MNFLIYYESLKCTSLAKYHKEELLSARFPCALFHCLLFFLYVSHGELQGKEKAFLVVELLYLDGMVDPVGRREPNLQLKSLVVDGSPIRS